MDFATHYHLADKRPFLNLSDLDDEELTRVMVDLERRRAECGLKRVFGPRLGLPQEPRPYHGRVFRLSELEDVVEPVRSLLETR